MKILKIHQSFEKLILYVMMNLENANGMGLLQAFGMTMKIFGNK